MRFVHLAPLASCLALGSACADDVDGSVADDTESTGSTGMPAPDTGSMMTMTTAGVDSTSTSGTTAAGSTGLDDSTSGDPSTGTDSGSESSEGSSGEPACGDGLIEPLMLCLDASRTLGVGPMPGPTWVGTGLFDDDEGYDIAVVAADASELVLLRGDGSGAFGGQHAEPLSEPSVRADIGDFDGDGDLDVAVLAPDDPHAEFALGDGQGVLSAVLTYSMGTAPVTDVAVGQFNLGVLDDIAIVRASDSVAQFITDPTTQNGGGDSSTFDIALASVPARIAIADFDGDGFDDAVVSYESAAQLTMIRAVAPLDLMVTESAAIDGPALELATGDFDGDGNTDVAAVLPDDDLVNVLLGDGAAGLGEASALAVDDEPVDVVAADFDGDGNLDLATANRNANTVSVLLGMGDGTFADAIDIVVGEEPVALASADFNADSVADLVTADRTGGSLTLVLSNP